MLFKRSHLSHASMDNEIVSLPVKENDERAIAQTQGKPTDHKTDSNNESMDEDNYVSQNPTHPLGSCC